jgi:hypothetical protein
MHVLTGRGVDRDSVPGLVRPASSGGLSDEAGRRVAQPRSSWPNRSQLSSIACWAAGEMVPMSKKPWIMPS